MLYGPSCGGLRLGLPLVPLLAQALGLSGDPARCLALLVEVEDHNPEGRPEPLIALRALQEQLRARVLEDQEALRLSQWYHMAIAELARCPGFRDDPAWIAQQLRPRITQREAQQTLNLLLSAGILRYEEDGCLRPGPPVVRQRSDRSPPAALQARQRESLRELVQVRLRLAERALLGLGPEERQFIGFTLAIPTQRLPELQERLQSALRGVLTEFRQHPAPVDQVVQVTLELFPMSERG